jgi:hypothetical protein
LKDRANSNNDPGRRISVTLGNWEGKKRAKNKVKKRKKIRLDLTGAGNQRERYIY